MWLNLIVFSEFSHFSFHRNNLIRTITNIFKEKLAKSVEPFSSNALTNEQHFIFIYIDFAKIALIFTIMFEQNLNL